MSVKQKRQQHKAVCSSDVSSVVCGFLSYYGVEAWPRINRHFSAESALNQLLGNRAERGSELVCSPVGNSVQLHRETPPLFKQEAVRSRVCLTSVTCATWSRGKSKWTEVCRSDSQQLQYRGTRKETKGMTMLDTLAACHWKGNK